MSFIDEALKNCIDDLESQSSDNLIKKFAKEYEEQEEELVKEASLLTILPSAILSSVLGYKSGRDKGIQDGVAQVQEQAERNRVQMFDKDYYSQMQNMSKNLNVNFTPFGVMYTVNYKNRPLQIENIETENMDNTMLEHYQNKNHEFFKNLFLNKVNLDLQCAEQEFARKLAVKQMDMQKKACDDEIAFSDILDTCIIAKEMMNKPIGEKYAMILEHSFEDTEEVIPLNTEKYAMLGDVMDFFGLNASEVFLKELRQKISNPAYIRDNVVIKFLPDRVIFIADGTVITQLKVTSMNEDGYSHFAEKDTQYFKKMLNRELRKKEGINKQASEEGVVSPFYMGDVNPLIYQEILNREFGTDWYVGDPAILMQEIERKFVLHKSIHDIAFNKILTMRLLMLNEDVCLSNHHVFEKVIRTFCDKPIDFTDELENNLDISEIAFGIKMIKEIIGNEVIIDRDIDVYIADTVTMNNERMFYPPKEIGLDIEDIAEINKMCIKIMSDKLCDGILNKEVRDESLKQGAYILQASCSIVDLLAQNKMDWHVDDIKKTVNKLKITQDMKNEIINGAYANLMIIDYLTLQEEILNNQREKFLK